MAFYTKYKGKDYKVDPNQSSNHFIDMSGEGRNTSTTQNNASTRIDSGCRDESGNIIYTEIASAFTQTITLAGTTAAISSWSVSRTSSDEEGASTGVIASGTTNGGSATVYLGDVLSSSATAKSSSTNFSSLAAPTVTTYTESKAYVKNPNAYVCDVYRNGSLVKSGLAANNGATFTDTGLSAGTSYSYTLKASNTTTSYSVSKTWNSTTVSKSNTLTFTGSSGTSNATVTSGTKTFTTPYKITVSKGTGVGTVTFSYKNNDTGNDATTTGTTFYAKKDTAFSWTGSPANYYFMSTTSGSGTANSSKTVSISATAGYYKVVGTVTNGTVQVSTDNSNWYDSVVAQYNTTVYLKIRGNSYYYYKSGTSLSEVITSKTDYGVGGPGKIYSHPLTTSYFSFTNTTPATSSSAANDSYKATENFGSCTAYEKIKLARTMTNTTISGVIISSKALGSTSTNVTVTWSSNVATNIYEFDTVRITANVNTMGSYKLVSSNFKYGVDRDANNLETWTESASNQLTTYQTTNSSRNGWTTTTASGSATPLVYSYRGDWTWSAVLTPEPSIVAIATATSWTYHGFTTQVSGKIGKNSSTTLNPFGSTGVSKLNYYPTTSIKVNGDIHMDSDAYNYDGTTLGGMNFWCSIKHASLSRSHNLYNNSGSTTQPTSIQLKLDTSGGGGAYKSYLQVWGVQVQE